MDAEVRKWLENATVGINRKMPGYVLKSGTELKRLGKLDDARAVLKLAIADQAFFDSIDIISKDRILTLLFSLLKEENPEEIIQIIDSIRMDTPGVTLFKATALGRLGRHDEAINVLEPEVKRQGENAKFDFVYKLGGLYMQKGRDGDAVDLIEPRVVGGPFADYAMLRNMLASAYMKIRRPDKAISLVGSYDDPDSKNLVEKAKGVTKKVAVHGVTRHRVFVIYGHDDIYKQLELTLHQIGAEPLIFDKLPKGGGTTVIELLEEHIPNADAVVALLTPDDEGRKRGAGEWELRARQNVLIEAGYALIARRRSSLIVALGGVSIPSDFEGIHRIQAESWNQSTAFAVAKRLMEIGLAVNPLATA